MADAVTKIVLMDTASHHVVHLTNISDGTGEAAVIKVDKSTLLASDGAEPDSLDIQKIRWNIQGFTGVRLLWDHTADDVAMLLSGNGFEDFKGDADDIQFFNGTSGLKDPRSSGGAGDLLLTTAGAAANATYDITIWLRKAAV